MTREGVDYAWSHPDPAGLQAAGITFACRYLSHDSTKNLTAGEAQTLIAHGISVVCNWEGTSGRASSGEGAGQADGAEAANQAAQCGAPPGAAIYFSADFDVQPSEYDAVRAYFRGARTGLAGRYALGAYGSFACLDMLGGLIDYAWQTYAWSHGQVHPSAHIYQYQNDVRVAGGDCDRDRALREPFGQWPGGVVSTDDDDALLLLAAS